MISEGAKAHRHEPAGGAPRFVVLLRESWWLLVLAGVAYLALVLGTYQRADPGWSFSGSGEPVLNKGGAFGAWLADVLLTLFGASAWWLVAGAAALLVAGYRRLTRPGSVTGRAVLAGSGGFGLLLLASAGIEALRLYRLPLTLPGAAGGVIGDLVGQGLASVAGFNGATLALLAFWAAGWSLFSGMSWLALIERIGAAIEGFVGRVRERWRVRRDREAGREAAQAREIVVEEVKRKVEDHEPIRIEVAEVIIEKSKRVEREKQRPLFRELPDSPLPPLDLLEPAPPSTETVSAETLEFTSRLIERKLADFGVEVQVTAAYPGPVITRYEIEPAVGVKGSQIVNLVKDLARALSVGSIRVVETIPGKSCMGLEIPNARRQIVRLVEILGSSLYNDSSAALALALGKDIAGKPVVTDLARMPHLLVAGTTGSGKSVAINGMILSLLYRAEPRQVRLILVDPKMLELSVYEGIPHLLAPVVTDMRLAANALAWCVAEMDRRYRLMSALGVRNLSGYNHKVQDAAKAARPLLDPTAAVPEESDPLAELPHVVVVIDELADLMMVAGKKVEEYIVRLAQKARAAGIHLVLATQRPSVDVITGLIKANVPVRIAFQVASRVDARTILDQMGAEALLGQGDMLFQPPGGGPVQRVHGAFVTDNEVHAVVQYLKQQGEARYVEGLLDGPEADAGEGASGEAGTGEDDPLYDQAVAVVLKTRRPSISLVQRHLRIGYNRAARLIEEMEKAGLVSPMQSNGNREVLVPARAE